MPGLPQVYVGLAAFAPGTSSPDRPAFVLADALLVARLHHRLRDVEGWVYDVASSWTASAWPDLWLAWTMTRPANADAVTKAVREEVARLRTGPVPPDELAHIRSLLAARAVADGRHERLLARAQQVLAPPGHLAPVDAWASAAHVTPEALHAFLARFLATEAWTELRATPA